MVYFLSAPRYLTAGANTTVARDAIDACTRFNGLTKIEKDVGVIYEDQKMQCLRFYNAHIEYCTGSYLWTAFSAATGKYIKCINEFDQKYPSCVQNGITSEELREEVQNALQDTLGGLSWFSQAALSAIWQAGEDFIRCGVTLGVQLANAPQNQIGRAHV